MSFVLPYSLFHFLKWLHTFFSSYVSCLLPSLSAHSSLRKYKPRETSLYFEPDLHVRIFVHILSCSLHFYTVWNAPVSGFFSMILHWSCGPSSWGSSPSPSLLEMPPQHKTGYYVSSLHRFHTTLSYHLLSLLLVKAKDFGRVVSPDFCHFFSSLSLFKSTASWLPLLTWLKRLLSYFPVTYIMQNSTNSFLSSSLFKI